MNDYTKAVQKNQSDQCIHTDCKYTRLTTKGWCRVHTSQSMLFLCKWIIADTARIRGCGVWRFLVSEVVWSHHSRVMCPANWFPFFISEVGGRLSVNRVFPRDWQTSTSGVGFQCKCFQLRSKSHTRTHTYPHRCADRCTPRQHDLFLSGHWRSRNRLPPPHPPGLVDLQSTFARIRSFFSWPKSCPRSCQVYFWHSQIIASLLTSP